MIIIGYEWWAYGNSLYYFLYFCVCLKFFKTRKWRCDFRDDVWDSWPPKWPHHDPLCNLLPHWIRAGPCDRREGDRCDFGELGHCDFCLALRSLALRNVSYHAVQPLKQPCGEVFKDRSQGLLPTGSHTSEPHEWPIVEVDSPAPVKPSSDCISIWYMTAASWGTSTLELPAKALLNLWPKKLWKIISVHCIKPQSLWVICYTAIENWCDVTSGFPTPRYSPHLMTDAWNEQEKDPFTLCTWLTC